MDDQQTDHGAEGRMPPEVMDAATDVLALIDAQRAMADAMTNAVAAAQRRLLAAIDLTVGPRLEPPEEHVDTAPPGTDFARSVPVRAVAFMVQEWGLSPDDLEMFVPLLPATEMGLCSHLCEVSHALAQAIDPEDVVGYLTGAECLWDEEIASEVVECLVGNGG